MSSYEGDLEQEEVDVGGTGVPFMNILLFHSSPGKPQ